MTVGDWKIAGSFVQCGMAIFQQQTVEENSGFMSLVKYFGHFTREGIDERFSHLPRHNDCGMVL